MADSEIVRSNAQVKAWSGLSMNLGGGLIAADTYRLFVEQKIDLTAASWTIIAATLMFVGHRLLELLEAES